ncbi:16S rRNA (uracil(1498)-N(3))-methyltransferase [Flagellimonas meridianipacifica]|uniref:Ribosomal RNA small subunit methyltransferase E n=1 Tax=Flagellimonas meridianipacifica TaxID=1080225 RepID=A0A2T0MCU9_9FLAO|nr:16S rRNA (uracil(1498)-N(3))-methyltransferase [Allomuricauda pacifica]PRX55327.1 16S rRNA (uracil1498-N3)-methyltransferase [Allomuricauda pacifica]
MQLFYNPTLDPSTTSFFFSPEESKHISRVLRKKEGDVLHITDGRGILYEAELLNTDSRKCNAQIIKIQNTKTKPYYLHLVVAPTKMNDRFEWFLEKATEIGVDEITPILCARSERKSLKLERMQRVLQSAMKQSLQTFLPKLNPLSSFNDFLENQPLNSLSFIAHCEENEKKELKNVLAPGRDTTILIGPEGDFSPEEIDMAIKKGYHPVAMGNTRLRTETAAIVACTAVALANIE